MAALYIRTDIQGTSYWLLSDEEILIVQLDAWSKNSDGQNHELLL